MHSQGLAATEHPHSREDPREPAFQARIDADDKIEPNDWMPDAYRRP